MLAFEHAWLIQGSNEQTQHNIPFMQVCHYRNLLLFLSAIVYNFEQTSYSVTEGSGVTLKVYVLRTGADGSTSSSVGMFDSCQDYHFSSWVRDWQG